MLKPLGLCFLLTLSLVPTAAQISIAQETGGSAKATQVLPAQLECLNLSSLYAHAFDFNQGATLKDVFAENGGLTISIAELRGAAAIVEVANKRAVEMESGEFTGSRGNARVTVVGQHVVPNFQFEMIDDEHARGMAYLTLLMWQANEKRVNSLSPSLAGYFEDKYILTQKSWRIESRVLSSVRSGML